jgi:serine/tyrosine/threonine adenylyltransferase
MPTSSTSSSEPDPNEMGWNLEQTYARLPSLMFAHVLPAKVQAPSLAILNERLAEQMGLSLGTMAHGGMAELFTGQQLPPGAQPIAQAYAGHQFGGFTMLGDGRAILLGEQRTPDGRLLDIQFKGSGPTPFSRGGDGRAAMGPMLREYLISEAMVGLGIPTTRGLAVATTGEWVYRERPLPGAILTRVAASHLRVGTFQFLAARRDEPNLRVLADYAISRHDPELLEDPERYRKFFRSVMNRQAALIAQWQLVGFIHGVMNTDNMALSGETIDYGPCAFIDAYHPQTVFSSIDHGGRYAYGNQPTIGQWNLARFAETLLPLIDSSPEKSVEIATEELQQYPDRFQEYWLRGMRNKLGLGSQRPGDRELAESLLEWMAEVRADFTNTFVDLTYSDLAARAVSPADSGDAADSRDSGDSGNSAEDSEAVSASARIESGRDESATRCKPIQDDRYRDPAFQQWLVRWRHRHDEEGTTLEVARARMRQVNPLVIPRNHRVEEVLSAATEQGDLAPLQHLLQLVSSPFEFSENEELAFFQAPPPEDHPPYRTFCGT